MTTAKAKKMYIDGRSSCPARTKSFILSVIGIIVAVLSVGHDGPHPNTITVVSAERAVEWRFTAEPEEAVVVLKQEQEHQAFHDLSSEIVELFDGYYDQSEDRHRIQSREEEGVEDDDDFYYFMRHGHRKTQESSSSTRV